MIGVTLPTHGILQSAQPPWTMRCLACNDTWVPASHTAGGLDRAAEAHWKVCPERDQ